MVDFIEGIGIWFEDRGLFLRGLWCVIRVAIWVFLFICLFFLAVTVIAVVGTVGYWLLDKLFGILVLFLEHLDNLCGWVWNSLESLTASV